ncbi:MAG: DUF1592 domain-containing protein [Myxococcota bacterium]
MAPRVPLTLSLLLSLGLLACTGTLFDANNEEPALRDETPRTLPPIGESCATDVAAPGPRSFRRLTVLEHNRTLAALLGIDAPLFDRLGADDHIAGFRSNSVTPLDGSQLETYLEITETASRQVEADELVSCDLRDEDCVSSFVESFGKRAFRRPLTHQERMDFTDLYRDAEAEWSAEAALQLLVQAFLLSPEHIYHLEIGEARDAGLALNDYETASALSYFLWKSMPDDALFAAAEAGELRTAAGIEAIAKTMLDDPLADASLAEFYDRWLDLDPELLRSPDDFPGWSQEIADLLRDEAIAFGKRLHRGGGGYDELFVGQTSVGPPALADWYGGTVEADGTIALPGERHGVLTLGAVLVSHSAPASDSWVFRGELVRERFLCQEIAPPPDDVADLDIEPAGRLTTTRCRGCHQLMDPIGMAFDQYDPVGNFVAEGAAEHAEAGRIYDADAVQMPERVSSVAELAEGLQQSPRAAECITRHWFRYALGREESDADGCALHVVHERFQENGDLDELLLGIVTSEAFSLRTASAEGGN